MLPVVTAEQQEPSLDVNAGTDIEVANLRRTGHYLYESGHHGDTWLDLNVLFVDQRRLHRIAGELAARLRRHQVEVVCGPLVGGALLGQWVAHHLDLPFVYAERLIADGVAARYRIPGELGAVVSGHPVAIVDDAINAGSATLATRDEILRLGGTPTVAGAIFIRDQGGIALVKANGLAVEHLVGLPFSIWEPDACPLCRSGLVIERTA